MFLNISFEEEHMGDSPRVIELVRKVVDYIDSSPNVNQFFPQIVAKAIDDTEAAAMLAFYVLQRAGAAERHIGYFCEKHALPLDERDGTCPACMEVISLEDDSAYAETYFTINKSALFSLREAAA
jgi:hypothetical protein